jgi:3-hydroxyisobutyrate dehydrogenase-like beta-hydroxyacid dehydrogenase
MTTIGFLGLGRMGAPMARASSAMSTGCSSTTSRRRGRRAGRQGRRRRRLGRRARRACDIVFTQPADPADRARRGRRGVSAAPADRLRPVDLGPKLAQELHDLLAPRGVASFDAPVSGGIRGAELGSLAIMVGGPEALYEDIRSPLDRIGNPFFMGEKPGAGQVAKLANNLLSLSAIATTAEAMTLAIKAGLDPARMIEVLNAGTGRQFRHPRQVAARGAAAHVRLRLFRALSLKDTRLALDERRRWACRCRPASAWPRLLDRTLATYGEDADFTAMAKVVEADAGLDPERKA